MSTFDLPRGFGAGASGAWKGLMDWLFGDSSLTQEEMDERARARLREDADEIERLIAASDIGQLSSLAYLLRDFGDGSNAPDIEDTVTQLLQRIEEGLAEIRQRNADTGDDWGRG